MKPLFIMPAEREARPEWESVPAEVRRQMESALQEPVCTGSIAWGGYTNSACFVLELASGRKVFAKGTHPGQDAHGVQTVRQEEYAYRHIPCIGEVSPAYLGTVSDGDEDGWTLMLFDHVPALPSVRWDTLHTKQLFTLLQNIHTVEPAQLPPGFPVAENTNYVERYFKAEGGWLRIAKESAVQQKFLSLFADPAEGMRWLQHALPVLCARQQQVEEGAGLRGVVHMDLRPDNALFTPERVYLVDWPNACFGPVAADVVEIVAGIAAEGVLAAAQARALYEETTGIHILPSELAVMLASVSGHLADVAYRQKPVKAPRLPWMRKRRLWEMLVWGEEVLGLPPPPLFAG